MRRFATKRSLAIASVLLSAATLLPGFFAPSFSVVPSFGDDVLDVFAMDYFPETMAPRRFSIVRAIASLFRGGDYGLGVIIFTFSILFPTVKLLMLACLCMTVRPRRFENAAHMFLKTFGTWSMLDVFVVAVIVVGFKSFPGGRIEREWGVFCFSASILFSMVASIAIRPERDAQSSDATASETAAVTVPATSVAVAAGPPVEVQS